MHASCGHTHVGVYLLQREVVYSNNSFIFIGGATQALQCITDRRPCCAAFMARTGEWFFPNGSLVPVQGTVKDGNRATTFYRDRGDDGTVNLNRVNANVMMPTGLFCCEVSNALNITQRLCIKIGKFIVQWLLLLQ